MESERMNYYDSCVKLHTTPVLWTEWQVLGNRRQRVSEPVYLWICTGTQEAKGETDESSLSQRVSLRCTNLTQQLELMQHLSYI